MKLWTHVLTSLLFVSQAWAVPPGNGYTTEGNAGCVDCMNTGNSAEKAFNRFIVNMNAITDGALHVEKIVSNKKKYAPKCDRFVDDGEFQDLGEIVVKEINRPENSRLREGPRDLVSICPRYRQMNDAEKDGVWVLFAAGWTQKEARCEERPKERPGPTVRNGRHATLAGILQLDKDHEHLYEYGVLCEKGDYKTAARSLRCGFSMLTGLNRMGQSLFSNGSYWEVLRPNAPVYRGHSANGATEIKKSIGNYIPCFKSPGQLAAAKRNNAKRVAQK